MTFKPIFSIILIIFIAFGVNVAAQSPNKILKQAGKALGEKSLRNLTSYRKTGKITRVKDGANGAYETQAAAPNLYSESYDLDGYETESGYNGKSGWRRDSRDGLGTLTGAESADFQAEALYRNSLWLDYKKQKSKISSGGRANINGKTANSIVLTTAKGAAIKLYFDAGSNLLLREEFPGAGAPKVYDYSDYRIIDGINEPFSINLKHGAETFEIKLDSIIHNQPISAAVFDFPQISGESLPDIAALFREVQANEDKIENLLESYSYTQRIIRRELTKDGVLNERESETNQLSFYKGYRISRTIEKNGKPLSEKDQADEDRNVQRRVEEIEKIIAKNESKVAAGSAPNEENKRVSIAEILRASRLVNPRRERFRGRDVIVFDFEPNPDFDMKNAKSLLKFFGKVGGVIWVDAKDKQVARIEAVLFDSFKVGGGLLANLKKGASFTLEQERVNDEIWLPSTADINFSIKVLLVKGININQVIKSYNYRKFSTEVKNSKIDEIKQP